MNMKSGNRKGGRGSMSNRHLKNTKVPNNFSCGGSNSLNWRTDTVKNSVNESNNYGYTNHYVASAFYMLVGLDVEIQKSDGNIYEGILETISSKVEFHLSHAFQKSPNQDGDKTGKLIDKIIFPFCDVLYCKAKSVDLDFAKRETLLTDNAISGSNGVFNERELVQWKPEEAASPLTSTALTAELGTPDMNDGWAFDDMMRVNEEKHGVKSTFDSSMSSYMTPIDKRDDDEYRARERRAEQVAREIQNDPKFKEMEVIDSGVAEEELFSAVPRTPPVPINTTSNVVNNVTEDNDGFISYTPKSYHKRFQKGQNSVAPRLQRTNMRNQDGPNHNSNHPLNRNHFSPQQRAQNGNSPRNNAYHYQSSPQQPHQSPSHGHIDNYRKVTSPAQQLQENTPPITNNRPQVDASSPRPLSYSAAAMKKNPLQASNRMPPAATKHTPPPPPTKPFVSDVQPVVHPPANFSPIPTTSASLQSTMMANGHLTSAEKMVQPLCMSAEALAAAKQQVIQDAKKKGTMGTQSPPLLPSTVIPSTQMTTAHTTCSPVVTTTHHQSTRKQASPPMTVKSSPAAVTHTPPPEVKEKETRRTSPVRAPSVEKSPTPPAEVKPESPSHSNISPKEQRSRTEDLKQPYFPKLDKKGSSIKDLKKFGEQFKLPEPKPKKLSGTKSVDAPALKSSDSPKPEVVVTTAATVTTTTTSPLRASPQSSPLPVVTTAVISSSITLVSTLTVTTSTTTAAASGPVSPDSALKYALNPSAKEFNPIKEPSPSPKPAVAKQPVHVPEITSQHAAVVPQAHQPATYYGGAVVINSPEVISPTVQSMPVKQIYARPFLPSGPGGAAVYSIPAVEYSNNGSNGGPQLIASPQSGYIPAQNIGPQQVIFVHGSPNGPASYQPVVNAHGQHYYSMQQMIRCVPGHPAANGVSPNRLPSNYQQDASPSGYVLTTVSQHGGLVQHQGSPVNQQHQGYHPPQSPVQSSHMQPQYVMSHQVANSYQQSPQNASQITYTQGTTTSTYRSPSAAGHHPQQPVYMMTHQGQHIQAVAMPSSQTYVQGQQHGGILSNYQAGN